MKKTASQAIFKAILGAVLAVAKRLVPLLYYCIILATILGVVCGFFSASYFKSPGKLAQNATIVIHPGSSILTIARQLGDENIIEFPELFAFILKLTKSSKSLKAGEYEFAPEISPIEVFNKLEAGDVVVRKITFAEGLTTHEILKIMENEPALAGEIPGNIGQGQLLPETYDYLYGELRSNLAKRMQDAMNKAIDELWEKRQPDLPLKTKQEAIILASIIEKETGVKEERSRVAAVFINRLKINMRLQTDPTVIYAITKGEYVLDRPLSRKDLAMESAYNTYLVAGLPPTPIASPGFASIEAALNPLKTDELYFVATGTGGHVFSSNIKQHNENVKNLRKIEKEIAKE